MSRKYDLIIFGASGFTGKFVVEECANLQKTKLGIKPFTWAVAGRSDRTLISALRQVSDSSGVNVSNEVDRIISDVNDYHSLCQMASQGSVIVNCVGPYEFYGEAVIRACLAEGTSYVDISGELQFLERMQALYNEEAEKKHVYIVGACGFDSLPADCGVVYLQQRFQGDVNSIECYLTSNFHGKPLGLTFSTWQSEIHFLAKFRELKKLSKQLYHAVIPPGKYKTPWRFPLHYSKVVHGFCIPFPGIDRRVIHRTQYYFFTQKNQRPVQYNAYMKMPSVFFLAGAMIVALFLTVLSQFSVGRYLLETYPKRFSLGVVSREGPCREDTEAIDFKFIMFARGWREKLVEPSDEHANAPDKKMKLVITGNNSGFGTTSVPMTQAALSILHEKHKMPLSGGVYSPGAAFAQTSIIERLCRRGLRFDCYNE